MTGLTLAAIIVGLLIFRVNLVLILMTAAIYTHYFWGAGQIDFFVQDVWSSMDREMLLAIPLFVVVGQIMARGSIAERLVGVFVELTRPIPGGLAVATILSCAMFSAVAGSSIVTMLAVGAVLFPALIEHGYSRRFALGALCAGGTLGIVIPPSVPMILYGIVTESSISDLFIAGIGPGILLTAVFSIYSMIVSRNIERGHFQVGAALKALKEGFWAMMMPVVLLGGIYSGYFSPTEAAAVAILYSVIVEALIYRDMRLRDFAQTLLQSGILIGTLFPLIAVAVSINLVLTENHVPQVLIDFAVNHVDSPTVFILIVNGILLVMGCFMDTGSALVVAAPLLQPIAENYGIDPINLGIIMILNLEIGILTPPLGMNLIVAMTAFNEKFGFICRSVVPWIVMMIFCLLLVTFIPWISMGLVH